MSAEGEADVGGQLADQEVAHYQLNMERKAQKKEQEKK
jgi:hypothetical protein